MRKSRREKEKKKGKDGTVQSRVGEKKDDLLLSFFLLVNYLVDDPFFDGRLTAFLSSTLFPPPSQNE